MYNLALGVALGPRFMYVSHGSLRGNAVNGLYISTAAQALENGTVIGVAKTGKSSCLV